MLERARHNRRAAGLASASVASLGTQSLASFGLQVVAAANIGAEGFGKFAIILGILGTLTALQAGLRDSAIVLEHHDAKLRGAVLFGQYAGICVAAIIAFGIAVITGLLTSTDAALLGLMVGTWGLEEMGRRFLIRDRRFVALWINDLTYAAGAFTALGIQLATQDQLTLTSILWSMITGSVLSFGLAIAQLPRGTCAPRHARTHGIGDVLRFAGWRSGQKVIRPLSLTLTRAMIATVTSTAVLGQVEAARLVVQPIWVLISGLGPFILTSYVRSETGKEQKSARDLLPISALLVSVTAVWGIIAVTSTSTVQRFIADDDLILEQLAVGGWAVFYIAGSMGLPAMELLVARKDSFGVFIARLIDGLAGIAFAWVLALLLTPDAVPLGLAAGAFIGARLLARRVDRTRQPVANPV